MDTAQRILSTVGCFLFQNRISWALKKLARREVISLSLKVKGTLVATVMITQKLIEDHGYLSWQAGLGYLETLFIAWETFSKRNCMQLAVSFFLGVRLGKLWSSLAPPISRRQTKFALREENS